MKTILIIEHDTDGLEELMAICGHGAREFTVRSARDEVSAGTILSDRHIDLIICSTAFPGRQDCQVIALLAKKYPYIPLIAIAPTHTLSKDQVLALGASAYLESPLQSDRLLDQINQLSEFSSTGTVRGIPIHSFLQMLETEGKTCTLHVFSNSLAGLIFIKDGVPINAETGTLVAEEAIYEIISWNDVIIDIKFFNGLRENLITKPLISLIMEGFRLKDERETQKRQEQTIVKPQHKLKQVSTAGQRLALDIGLRMKLEFDTLDSALDSVLIGMIPDNCIIAATPSHFIVTKTELLADTVIVVKYMYLGKLCLFKSKILKVIDSPQHMLFLDYPSVIHYHEMRKAKRTAIYIPCSLDLNTGSRFFGVFRDLSTAGGLCQVKTKGNTGLPEVSIGQDLSLSCLLPGLKEEEVIKGIVRNFKKNGSEIQIGIEFSELHSYLKETIERYLHSVENVSVASAVQLDTL